MRSSLKYRVCVWETEREWERERPRLCLVTHLFTELYRQALESWTVCLPFISLSPSLSLTHLALFFSIFLTPRSFPPGLFPFISVPVFHFTASSPTPSHTQTHTHTHGGGCSGILQVDKFLSWFRSSDFNQFPLELKHNHLTLLPACLGAPHRCLNYWPTYLSFLECVDTSGNRFTPSAWKKLAPFSITGSNVPIDCQYLFPRPNEYTVWCWKYSIPTGVFWSFFKSLPSTLRCQNIRKVLE